MIVSNARDAAQLLAPYFAAEEGEGVAVLLLDAERRLLTATYVDAGEGAADLPVRDILAAALRVGATSVIVARNHKSGDVAPTAADTAAARRLAEAAATVDVELADHLIFAGGECRSFRELKLL
ncbi:MAG TPA: JAB domain-containing protein [Allosphingosinicella sp.]